MVTTGGLCAAIQSPRCGRPGYWSLWVNVEYYQVPCLWVWWVADCSREKRCDCVSKSDDQMMRLFVVLQAAYALPW